MNLPGTLRKSELRRKIVIVAKKQAKNLPRLIHFMKSQTALQGRRVLLVDDEADLASVKHRPFVISQVRVGRTP